MSGSRTPTQNDFSMALSFLDQPPPVFFQSSSDSLPPPHLQEPSLFTAPVNLKAASQQDMIAAEPYTLAASVFAEWSVNDEAPQHLSINKYSSTVATLPPPGPAPTNPLPPPPAVVYKSPHRNPTPQTTPYLQTPPMTVRPTKPLPKRSKAYPGTPLRGIFIRIFSGFIAGLVMYRYIRPPTEVEPDDFKVGDRFVGTGDCEALFQICALYSFAKNGSHFNKDREVIVGAELLTYHRKPYPTRRYTFFIFPFSCFSKSPFIYYSGPSNSPKWIGSHDSLEELVLLHTTPVSRNIPYMWLRSVQEIYAKCTATATFEEPRSYYHVPPSYSAPDRQVVPIWRGIAKQPYAGLSERSDIIQSQW